MHETILLLHGYHTSNWGFWRRRLQRESKAASRERAFYVPLPASESEVSMFSSRKGGAMMFRQLFDQVSGTYSYLLASRPGGEALIIDPVLEKVDRYLQLVKELDLKLVKAVDTHLHADHRPWRAARPYPLHHRDGRTD